MKYEWSPGECVLHLPTGQGGIVESADGGWVVFCPFGRHLGHGFTAGAGEFRPLGHRPDALEALEAECGLL